MSIEAENSFQVAVLGSGLSGTLAAWSLARDGIRVALLAPPCSDGPKMGDHLPAAAVRLLRKMGVSDALWARHRPSFGRQVLWESLEPNFVSEFFDPYGQGLHIDRTLFDTQLNAMAQSVGVERMYAGFQEIEKFDGQHWHLRTDNGQNMRCQVVIDASGRQAVFVRALGYGRLKANTLTCHFALLDPPSGQSKPLDTMIEAEVDGWWYAATLPNGQRLVALHCLETTSKNMTKGKWLDKLHSTRLARTVMPNQSVLIHRRDASTLISQRFCGSNWIALGDATYTFDPIAAQGLFHAIATAYEAMPLTRELLHNVHDGITRYRDCMMDTLGVYLGRRRRLYGLVRRFGQSPFWKAHIN